LAICSVLAGYVMGPMLYGGFFDQSIYISGEYPVMQKMAEHFHGAWSMVGHGFFTSAFVLLVLGSAIAYLFYSLKPELLTKFVKLVGLPIRILEEKYGFDILFINGFARFGTNLGRFVSTLGDRIIIDGIVVNGSAAVVRGVSELLRKMQTGYLYSYAFAMIIGLIGLLTYFYTLA
ncbi:MAG: NADH-quinone oxidoreductase subunit L, partial [Pseudomonadota bacterium]